MRKITIKLDEATAEWVRVRAAQLNTSVSRFVCDLLAQQKRAFRHYESAWQWFRERELRPLSQPGEAYPDRVGLHVRPGGR
jgi:hypothetical protein